MVRKGDAPPARVPSRDVTSASVEKATETGPLGIGTSGQEHTFLFRVMSPDALTRPMDELVTGQEPLETGKVARPLLM